MKIIPCISFALLVLAGSCSLNKSANKAESRVDHFEYQGYGDTIVSLLYGEVYEDNDKNQPPVADVRVTVLGDSTSCVSDNKGEFVLGMPKGIFELTISKPGYQSLILSNYNSDPDRVSLTKIILVKGSGEIKYKIPEHKE